MEAVACHLATFPTVELSAVLLTSVDDVSARGVVIWLPFSIYSQHPFLRSDIGAQSRKHAQSRKQWMTSSTLMCISPLLS